jgi:hypothetical protein
MLINLIYFHLFLHIRWAGHVAGMGEKRNVEYWWESQKERDHWEGVNNIKWILER